MARYKARPIIMATEIEVELEDLGIDMYDMPAVDPSERTPVRFGADFSGELNNLFEWARGGFHVLSFKGTGKEQCCISQHIPPS